MLIIVNIVPVTLLYHNKVILWFRQIDRQTDRSADFLHMSSTRTLLAVH